MAALTVDRVTRAAIKGSADPKPRAIGAITTVGSQKGMSARLSLTGTISSRWCSYQTSSRCRSRSAGGSAPSAQHSPAGAAPACRHSPFPAGKRSEPGSSHIPACLRTAATLIESYIRAHGPSLADRVEESEAVIVVAVLSGSPVARTGRDLRNTARLRTISTQPPGSSGIEIALKSATTPSLGRPSPT